MKVYSGMSNYYRAKALARRRARGGWRGKLTTGLWALLVWAVLTAILVGSHAWASGSLTF